jgi:hypothetical protein
MVIASTTVLFYLQTIQNKRDLRADSPLPPLSESSCLRRGN